MAKVKVYNMNAEEVGTKTLKDSIFGNEYNEGLIHEVIVAYNANQRQGTKSPNQSFWRKKRGNRFG